ncbi:hypothetical protein K505DRAFT_368664 [Melanomma pulvis-pyrius CBS 109.77]|uniref:Uncharacterized protein n=1 Tax=Melanomma pulvis-pyrius CBS 109.77 TaxID=1314802 RepID=A0A6A6WPA6_9PLEO|nr:hypothetical protein K505DRAFT_368664 [Melanomma pulvis-pyrius CBS 109.77]
MTSATYNLSADLTLMILMELESPTDLYSFVRTAKPIYQIFQCHKASILAAVLRNAVHPEAMRDFLLANRAFSICSLSARQEYLSGLQGRSRGRLRSGEYRRRRLQRVNIYLDSNRGDEIQENFRNLDTLYSLCKLWTLVDGFINDFAARALAELRQSCLRATVSTKVDLTSEKLSSTPLSELERARLFRAFCRFEEYRRLYGGPDHVCERNELLGENLVQEEFKERYHPWELLEIITLHSYLKDRMTRAVEEQEDAIFKMFTENVEREGDAPESVSLQHLELYGLHMFDDRYSQECQVKFMVELGLPFFKHICTTDFGGRLLAMTNFTNDSCSSTLETALGGFISTHRVKDDRRVQGNCEEITIKQLSRENSGYHYFSHSDQSSRHLLEKAGIIFWDQTRLDMIRPGVFDNSKHFAFGNGDTFTGRGDSTPPLLPRPRPTILERLQGRVRIDTLNQLEQFTKYWYVGELIGFLDDLEY